MSDILKLCCKKTKKTRILYQANLSFDQLEKYLKISIEKGLVTMNVSPRNFQTSQKGMEFIDHVEKIKRLLN